MQITGLNLPRTTPQTPLKLYTDASLNHNTGISTAGFVFAKHTGEPTDTGCCTLGSGYNTVGAEQEAIKRALDVLDGYEQVNHVIVHSDAKNVVSRIDEDALENGQLESVRLEWIPREENSIADALAEKAMGKRPNNSGETYAICD